VLSRVLNHFSAEDIGAAKKLLCYEFQGKLTGNTWTERQSSTSRAAHEAEIDDILVIFDTLDVHNTLEGYLFVGTNLSSLPKFGPEEMNIAAITDRQVHMEEAVRELSSNISALKPNSADIEQRLSVFKAAILSQLEKLAALSDQLTATATLVKDFGSPARHNHSHSNSSTIRKYTYTEASKQVLVAVHSELADKHRRRRNVIVSGIQPVEIVDDCILFSSICEANLPVKPHVTSTQCRRLGRPGGKRPQLLRVTLHSDEEATSLLSVARKLRCSDDEVVRSSVYINRDLTPAEIQLAYEQRQRRRQLKSRPEVSRPTESTSTELQSDYADKQNDYALNFPVLTVTNRSDDAERMS